MFERVLETVLQKALGEFVQDINSKDLKLAVWSGNVVLKNLRLKPEALAKLDLPVFVYAGLIGNLELAIPWKALWTAPTKVTVENVVLLVVPKDAAPYSEEKAKKEARQKKKNMLEAVEEAQERMRKKGGKEEKQTWAESLITAIIKNLEIKVKNIHVRYEDPTSGYAAGVTLDRLSTTTTDEMWRPAVIGNQGSTSRIYKLSKIENFCKYWNNPIKELFRLPQSEIEKELLKLIVTKERPNTEHSFVIHPMNCTVKMIIDPSNNVMMDIPKFFISVHFTSLITEIRRTQFLNTMSLIDSMERGKKKQPFAKWHPGVPIIGNAKKWWNYLLTYAIESRVKRKVYAWRWSVIRQHRHSCRDYTTLRIKEMTGKLSLNEIQRKDEIFDNLDIVNITICEQNAKLEAEKLQANQSWFGSWWSSGKQADTMVNKFGITTDEKDLLYNAIEQSEAAASSQIYPEKYVKLRLKLEVDKVSFKLNDNYRVITEAAVQGINTDVDMIPNGNGIVVKYQIQNVFLASQKSKVMGPTDANSIVPICEGVVQVNPTDNPADIVIISKFSSVTLIFDMDLINSFLDFTKTDEELTDFDELRKNYEYYSARLKSQGKSGLLYAIEKRKIVDVNVTLSAPRVVIPEGGAVDGDGPLIVADLGRLMLTTEVGDTRSPRELLSMSMAELEETAYDNYQLHLDNCHVKIFDNKDEWQNEYSTSLDTYLLYPLRLNVNLSNSILPDDKKLPKIKCQGHLDVVRVSISDKKIQRLYRIVDSLPKSDPAKANSHKSKSSVIAMEELMVDADQLAVVTSIVLEKKTSETLSTPVSAVSAISSSTDNSDDFFDAPDHFIVETDGLITQTESLEFISQTIVSADFTLNAIHLDVFKEGRYEGKVMCKFHVRNIEANFVKTTWMQKVEASLGEIKLSDCHTDDEPIELISSPAKGTLISVACQMNDPEGPYFESDFHNREMTVMGTFDKLSTILHVESFLNIYEFGMGLLPKTLSETIEEEEEEEEESDEDVLILSGAKSTESVNEDLVKIHISAVINNISVSLKNSLKIYSNISISNCAAEVIMKVQTTEVRSSLSTLDVRQADHIDMYQDILSVDSSVSNELISFVMVQHNHKLRDLDPDLELDVKMGSVHFVFLNFFIQNLLHILDTFSNTKERMVAASIETAKLAKESTKSSLVSLRLHVDSPVVIVPRNSTDNNALKIVLGNINLENKFSLTRDDVIMDEILIGLSHIAISRVLVGSSGKTLRERSILVPFDMELKVLRCLVNNSDIKIKTKLYQILANMGYEDYHMIMQILQENLTETGDRNIQPAEAPQTQEEEEDITPRNSFISSDPAPEGGGKVTIGMEVQQIVCLLYSDETPLDPADPECEVRREETMLMYSEAIKLTIDLVLQPDGEKIITVRMWDIRVEDTDKEILELGVQRILSHKMLANQEAEIIKNLEGTTSAIPARRAIVLDLPHAMIDLSLTLSPTGDLKVVTKLQDIHLVVSWGFINNLVTFVTVPPQLEGDTQDLTGSGSQTTLRDITLIDETSYSYEVPTKSNLMQIKLQVKNPELVFLSNHTTWKTQALLLRTALDLQLNQHDDGRMVVTLSVDHITMFICQYFFRLNSIYLLLQPCDVTLMYTKREDKTEGVDLNISELIFNISPESLNVMMTISTQFSSGEGAVATKKEHTAYAYNLWNMETIGDNNRWYIRQAANNSFQQSFKKLLGPDQDDLFSVRMREALGQVLQLTMESFQITLEADYEPLIVFSGKCSCEVKDWAGAMFVDLDLYLSANYYSYTLGTFEPMLEPVEISPGEYRMWNVSCTVKKCPVELSDEQAQIIQVFGLDGTEASDTASQSSVDSMDIMDNAPPLFDVQVTSSDKLLLTITSSALKNIRVLGEAWSSVSDVMKIEPRAVNPLMVHNQCGVGVTVRGRQTGGRAGPAPEFSLEHNEKQALKLDNVGSKRVKERGKNLTRGDSSQAFQRTEIVDAASINIEVQGYEEIKDVQIVQAGVYIYGLVPAVKSSNKRERNLLVEVTVVRSSKTVTIRSPLNFHNLQRVPVRLWYSAPDDTTNREMVDVHISETLIGRIGAGEKYSVPLDAPICGTTDSHHFHLTPDTEDHAPSLPPLTTTKLKKELQCFVSSYPKSSDAEPVFGAFTMQALNVSNPRRLNLQNALYHTILISPSVVIANKLPVTLRIQGAGSMMVSKDITPGARDHFDMIDLGGDPSIILRIINYHDMGFDWSGEFEIDLKKCREEANQSVVMTASVNNITNRVTLGVIAKVSEGLLLTIHSSFWMVNCTGKQLRYQGLHDSSEILDPPSIQQPMMFSFLHSDKNKQKLRIKVDKASWSDYFSIETVGSSGSITSYLEQEEVVYEIGITIALSNISLTKIVTFYPRFQVINELSFPISIRGDKSMALTECPTGKVTPFWPGVKNDHALVLKIRSGTPTMPVPLDTTQQTVIRADCSTEEACRFISVVVFVDVRTATTEIRIGAYYLGAAPVRIENLLIQSSSKICFHQEGSMNIVTLAPKKSILYTWDFPGKKREIRWYIEGDERNKKKAEFYKDNCENFIFHDFLSQSRKKAQVVSFLDGLQRVLLFTDLVDIAECVGQEVLKIEQDQLNIVVNFPEAIGVSLVDGIPQEVTYMQLDSSGAIWERKFRNRDRYKYLPTKISQALEEAYLRSTNSLEELEDHQFDMSDPDSMVLTFPNQSCSVVRRTYLSALWVNYTSSPSQQNIHFKINRLQIDNQLTDFTFRHVFYPIKPPDHAIAQQPPKPLMEFCLIKQTQSVEGESEQSVLDHYKYVKMLIQEFHIKLDAGFLLSLMNFFKVDQEDIGDLEKLELEWLNLDLKLSRTALDDRDGGDEGGGPPVFLDEFQLSPLKIHVSFSPEMNIDTTQVHVQEDTLTLYLRSFGLGLVAINDAVLKLAYYDATGQLCTKTQLQDRVTKHYVHQTLTQLYAVVFGLDILGNPYGLVQDIKTGTKDLFYEPYQGIVQGPREFAEGVVIGVNSFLRHGVGGVVGAASKISRSLGKGLAKLTFDEAYQKQRARQIAQKPSHIGEGLARGGKSLLMGLYHGVTGVVLKPVEGAATEGVEGFFKGVGKGLVGAVTRPLGGINDMITYTIDGIHHHTQIDEKILVLRHPRYIQPDKILRPYNTNQSEGKYLLSQIARHTHWTDMYYHHSLLTTKSAFILTDQRCVLSEYDDVMNSWKVEWAHVYQDVESLPYLLDNGLGLSFSAFMDPNVGFSKFFKNRRKKTRTVVLPCKEETQATLEKLTYRLHKTNKKRFNQDSGESCWNTCCRCL